MKAWDAGFLGFNLGITLMHLGNARYGLACVSLFAALLLVLCARHR